MFIMKEDVKIFPSNFRAVLLYHVPITGHTVKLRVDAAVTNF